MAFAWTLTKGTALSLSRQSRFQGNARFFLTISFDKKAVGLIESNSKELNMVTNNKRAVYAFEGGIVSSLYDP